MAKLKPAQDHPESQIKKELRIARMLTIYHRAQGLAALNRLFRRGKVPDPALNGSYKGEFLALDLAPGLTQVLQWAAKLWMPWLGKTFDVTCRRGDNIFSQGSYPWARLFNPLYRGFIRDSEDSYRAFAFHTHTGPGLVDPNQVVLKIDYNLTENPSPTVRRVLDELVQLEEDLYLGKACVRWWWRRAGDWQTVGYFTLKQ